MSITEFWRFFSNGPECAINKAINVNVNNCQTCTHEFDEFIAEFEVWLPVHVVSGRRLEKEAEVDVDHVTVLVNHDVAIVSIFDL